MKVGDIVKINGVPIDTYFGLDLGIVLKIEYIKNGQYWITCLWNDGTIEGLEKNDLEVIK